jgi:DNA-binding HxlR family transcriptional regulator
MAPRRSYGDGCATAHALDLIGERWALLVVRELLLGPKRFTDLRADLPGMSPNILARRLRELGQADITRHRRLPPPAAANLYELTERGQALKSVIYALGRWAIHSPCMPLDAPLSNDSHILSLGILFDPAAARDLTVRLNLWLGEQRFRICVLDGELELARGEADDADATVHTDAATLQALVRNTKSLSGILAAGQLRIDGDVSAVALLPRLFRPAIAST